MPPTSSRARFSSSPRLGRGSPSRASASSSRASVFGPIPGTLRSRPVGRRRAKLVGRADAERPRELDRALRAEPQVAAETDQVGRELALELCQLGDLARLDELAQPRLDPRADSAQLAHAPDLTSSATGDGGAADRLGGATVGARACTGSRRRARATPRTRPAGRRSRGCPRTVVSRRSRFSNPRARTTQNCGGSALRRLPALRVFARIRGRNTLRPA